MGDNRAAGLIIVVAALVFLWLYDTGRWKDIQAVLAGRSTGYGTGTASGDFGSSFGLLSSPQNGGLGNNGQNGQVSDGAIGTAICAAWVEACPFTPLIDPAKDVINSTLGSIFGFKI